MDDPKPQLAWWKAALFSLARINSRLFSELMFGELMGAAFLVAAFVWFVDGWRAASCVVALYVLAVVVSLLLSCVSAAVRARERRAESE